MFRVLTDGARHHPEWGQQATYNMIKICLNPDNETLGSEAFSDELDEEQMEDSKDMALKTAQKLLAEIKHNHTSEESLNQRLLENFWLLETKQKHNIEKALQDFLMMASKDMYRDHVGVVLGIATVYMLQKQVQKARNHLKRIVKNQWNFEDAEYLERCWLLLIDIYIQSGKMELPVELIQRILRHNKSCYKAYEYAGFIAEKEQLYKDAALQYENAWKYEGQTNPAIGYKLAFNYLKGKRYAEAIDVCNTVLKLYPDYPKIQKDILEKSRNNLRT